MENHVVAIACVDRKLGIGYQNSLQFNIKEDKNFFKNVTSSNCIVMGGNTYRSIGSHGLRGRENIVLSRSSIENDPSTKIYRDLDALKIAIDKAKQKSNVYIIGGQKMYEQLLDMCDMILLTHVYTDFAKADAFFPSRIHQIFSPTFEVAKWIAFDKCSQTNLSAEIILYAKSGIEIPQSYRKSLEEAFNRK